MKEAVVGVLQLFQALKIQVVAKVAAGVDAGLPGDRLRGRGYSRSGTRG